MIGQPIISTFGLTPYYTRKMKNASRAPTKKTRIIGRICLASRRLGLGTENTSEAATITRPIASQLTQHPLQCSYWSKEIVSLSHGFGFLLEFWFLFSFIDTITCSFAKDGFAISEMDGELSKWCLCLNFLSLDLCSDRYETCSICCFRNWNLVYFFLSFEVEWNFSDNMVALSSHQLTPMAMGKPFSFSDNEHDIEGENSEHPSFF